MQEEKLQVWHKLAKLQAWHKFVGMHNIGTNNHEKAELENEELGGILVRPA